MDVKTYDLPEKLDVLRHQVINAVSSSDDKVILVMCLNMLTNKHKHHHTHRGLSDEELAAKLASFPNWDEVEHADLSQIDYSKYKPYRSPKVMKTMEKWL